MISVRANRRKLCPKDRPKFSFLFDLVPRFFASAMTMLCLRTFVSEAHARALQSSGLLDREVADPLMEERLTRIRAQITAALALHEQLTEMGYEIDAAIDLYPLVRFAQAHGILNKRQAGVLLKINMDANQAKHELIYVSRL